MVPFKKFVIEPRAHRIFATCFFVAFLIVGLCIYGDYGISWDEPTSRDLNGLPNYLFIAHGDAQAVKSTAEKYHGPAFEILLIFIEKGLGLTDPRDIYLVRHLVTFLLFFAATLVFYRLLRKRFHDRIISLFGVLFLILSPRIFADAFYNSKDLAFLSCFIFALATLDRLLRNRDYRSALLHAGTCSFAIDVRNVAMVMPVITVILIVCLWRFPVQGQTGESVPRKPLLVYLVALAVFVTLFWPVLWFNPPYHFYRALQEMRRFPWSGSVLYLGETVNVRRLPWHYIPVWLAITTPLAYSFFFVIGSGQLLRGLWQAPRRLLAERPMDLAMALSVVMPVAAVIVLRSVLYDGWRHLYFIYPAFLFFAVLGFATLYEGANKLQRRFPWAKASLLAIVSIPLAATGWTMVEMHPHQYVYFNPLAGRNLQEIEDRFEMDYWGVSCLQGLEYLVQHDPAPEIRVFAATDPARHNAMLLPMKQRERLVFTDSPADADYLITHFRWAKRQAIAPEKDFYSVRLRNSQIMAVQKIH